MSQQTKKNYLIIGILCSVALIMAVAYAAFANQLKIDGTSEVTGSWNVKIMSIQRVASSGAGVSDDPSPSYDNTNGLTANFSTKLTSPGDYAIYKIKVQNFGNLNAKLSQITLNASESNDITYYVNKNQDGGNIIDSDRLIDEDDVLNPAGDADEKDVGYVYVSVKYNSYEGQTSPTGANKVVSATVKLDFIQSATGAGTSTSSCAPDGTAYYFQNNLEEGIGRIYAGDCLWQPYETDYEDLNKTSFLKVEVESGLVSEIYTCKDFDFLDEPICLGGGYTTPLSGYNASKSILEDLADEFEEAGGECSSRDSSDDRGVDVTYECKMSDDDYISTRYYSLYNYGSENYQNYVSTPTGDNFGEFCVMDNTDSSSDQSISGSCQNTY